MLNIAGNPAFMAIADGDTSNQIASGDLCAIVSGTWDAQAAQEAFGADIQQQNFLLSQSEKIRYR